MRHKPASTTLALLLLVSIGLAGCETARTLKTSYIPENSSVSKALGAAAYLNISEPTLYDVDNSSDIDILSISPNTAIDYNNVSYRDITLEQCVRSALQSSEVFRELGGAIVNQPAIIPTTLDPALQYTNPLTGEEASLSAFDANLNSNLFFENISRPFNNQFSGDQGLLEQDLLTSQLQFSKIAATGTEFTSTADLIFDANNQTGNRFGSAWGTELEAGFKHPLLQGSGTLFNRIAGPGGGPGNYNGVLIARTNNEISLADFEDSVREFVSNIENAYWDLHFAYRELEVQITARDTAADVARTTRILEEEEKIGKLELASAYEQFLRFESALIESMEGRLIDGTQVNSGSPGGSFQRTAGVRTAERRLRYLLGMPITDGVLLKPVDQPVKAALAFDWEHSVGSALTQRPEIRRQKWVIRQRELELTAARNFLLPRFDIVGNYRAIGLGRDLAGGGVTFTDDVISNASSDDAQSSAIADLFSGDFQELQIGAELALPIGFRQAHAGVRNAELAVQRERIVLKEQQRKIMLDLSNVISECRRAFNAMKAAEQRVAAATEYLRQAEERLKTGRVQYDVLLEAQRRILEGEIQFINAEVEYALAIKNVHFERATLLNYHGIGLAESQSNPRAQSDYRNRILRTPKLINYVVQDPPIGKTTGSGIRLAGCSQCDSASGDCGCASKTTQIPTTSASCSSCGGSSCTCASTTSNLPQRPSLPKNKKKTWKPWDKELEGFWESESGADDTDLPADRAGKKHVYVPKNLPPPSPK